MKQFKHFLLTVAALLCSTSMLGVEVEIDGINYELIEKAKQAKVIAKSSGKYTGTVVIPESVEYEGVSYAVTSIGDDAFSRCSGLTSVTIGNSVTSIGRYAFEYCFGLTSVTIPNSVTSIESGAFAYCSGLTSVTIPNSVTSIGWVAFSDCSGLKEVHISDIAAWCNIEFISYESNPLYYARHLYMNGEEVTDLIIPEGVTAIKDYAFWYCSGLTSVTIPNSVTSIGDHVFYDCSGLTSVTIPNSVTSIGFETFSGCSGLTSVTIPNSVERIGQYAFFRCSGLTSVTIGNSVTSIGSSAFKGCSDLTDVYCYAEEVPSTDSDAFADSYVEYATLHVSDASIGNYKATTPWSGFGKIIALTEEETGIEDIAVEDVNINNAPVYNIQGMKMQNADNLPKGVYIKGGKKFVIK